MKSYSAAMLKLDDALVGVWERERLGIAILAALVVLR